ncbi:MAG TPA: sigma-54 dependent transcriptional regulator [Bryobacteraceae bacterium]|jgi:DNA-binding NtrC family response regulator|nr:sigma-54 dependent transcriptional regulator [Bryobacteraceae bacterium]
MSSNPSQANDSTRVLVVEDDARQRNTLAGLVESFGFHVIAAAEGQEAIDLHSELPVDIILTDLVMPRMDGSELLRKLEERGDRTPVIVLTAFGSIEKAISIVHDFKAFWFLEKPVEPVVLRSLIDRGLEHAGLLEERALLHRQLSHHGILGEMVGTSREMRSLFALIGQVAPTSATVLVTGESGTGKELVARAIHRLSTRSAGPFVAVNCAALTETLIESELFGHEKGSFTGALDRHPGCFEQADKGTVLLDEIGDMPIGTQAKLLRVLEDQKVRRIGGKTDLPIDVRLIAATNKITEDAIRDKLLREDLFYRLNVFRIQLPALREHKEDIAPISASIIELLNEKHRCRVAGIHPVVMEHFLNHSWPGNVRELRNVLERAVILAREGMILEAHLAVEGNDTFPADAKAAAASMEAASANAPEPLPVPTVLSREGEPGELIRVRRGATMEELEDAYIELVLQRTKYNKTRAAEILGISVRTLHNRRGHGKQRASGQA